MHPWLLFAVLTTGPLSPEESRQAIQHAPDVQVTLVAHEPQVIDPVSARFDEAGRLWVVEMRDYPTGPVDGQGPQGTIKILRDQDGDGFYETSKTFVNGLWFPTGVQPWRDGVIVTLAGSIEYMRDVDHDDQCDQREVWFEGFATDNTQLRANHPLLAPDGRVYIANGLRSGQIVSKDARWPSRDAPVPLTGRDFTFAPQGGFYGTETGGGQFGMSVDDFGNRVVCSNRNPCDLVAFPASVLARDGTLTPQKALFNMAKTGTDSELHPLVKAWTTSNLHAGQFTAACGVHWYHGDALPQDHQSNVFVCDPTGSLVQRQTVEATGSVWRAKRVVGEAEFLASRDPWFRAVDLTTGPDGALYVVDMYRAVIEHPDFVPTELKHRPDERLGNDRGRIYRVTSAGTVQKPSQHLWSNMSVEGAIERLTHSNLWQRETAGRWLYERALDDSTSAQKIVLALQTHVQNQQGSLASRARAIGLLHALNGLDDKVVSAALQDQAAPVLETALRYASTSQLDLTLLISLCEQASPSTDRFMAQVLGEWTPSDAASEAKIQQLLTKIAMRAAEDDSVMQSILGAVRSERCHDFLLGLLHSSKPVVCSELKRHLAYRIGLDANPLSFWSTLPSSTRADSASPVSIEASELAWINQWAQGIAASRRSIQKLHVDADTHEARQWERALEVAYQVVADPKADLAQRLEALNLVRFDTDAKRLDQLWTAWQNETEPKLRVAGLDALSQRQHSELASYLLEHLMEFTPELRRKSVDVLIANPKWAEQLLKAMELNTLPRVAVDLVQSQRLTRSNRPEIAELATKLLAGSARNRQAVIDRYKEICEKPGNPKRGEQVFRTACANCHRIGEIGIVLGPDISDSRTKSIEQLLQSILDPDAAIDAGFVRYTLLTSDGRVIDGLLVDETAEQVVIRPVEGPAVQVPKRDVESLKSAGVSLMPTGFETTIQPAAMRDLLAYIKQWRYLEGAVPADVKSIK